MLYRRQERIPDDLGTAVNICSMVFGNGGDDSGTGVAFTRDPASGAQGVYGDYLQNAQGEDVVAGIRNTVPLADLEQIDKASYDELLGIMADARGALPRPVRHRVHHRARQALDAADPGRQAHRRGGVPDRLPARRPGPDRPWTRRCDRVTGAQLAQLMFPRFDADADRDADREGHERLPGRRGRQGGVRLRRRRSSGPRAARTVILVRRETNPDDLRGMVAARGILTSRGGKTSHAAVVARGMGRTCVCGADSLDVDVEGRADAHHATAPRSPRATSISIDGTTGEVFPGEVPVRRLAGRPPLRGRRRPPTGDELVAAVAPADGARRRPRAGWACGPTPTPPTTPPGPAASAPRASACAAPSTCSSATGRRWSRT